MLMKELRLLKRSVQTGADGHDRIGVAQLAGGIAIAVSLIGCSASPVSAAFTLRPVLNAQSGSCAHRSSGVPGIHGGCYQLAAFGVLNARAQSVRAFPYTTRGSYIVVIILGPDARPALMRMMQPPFGALPAPNASQAHQYQVPRTLGIVQDGKVLAAFPPLVGLGAPGTPVRVQVNGLTRAQAENLVSRLGT